MKKLIICALAAPFILGLTACKKDNDNTATSSTTGAYVPSATSMTARLDGVAFPVGSVAVSSSGGISTIYLSNPGASTAIFIMASNDTPAGTYTLSSGSSFPGLVYNDGSYYFTGSSGSIVISSNDTVHKVMKGTFSGTVTNSSSGLSHTVSDGTFVMNYF